MNEYPLIVTTELIPKVLDGTKTQTRRVIKPQPDLGLPEYDRYSHIEVGKYHPTKVDKNGEQYPGDEVFGAYTEDGEWGWVCPYGQVGDRLWVRETWNCFYLDYDGYNGAYDLGEIIKPIPKTKPDYKHCVLYRATHDDMNEVWRPSIHIPRWASRITLDITNLRVERLQEIMPHDCILEGIAEEYGDGLALRDKFETLWDTLNAKRGHPFESNPWVWVIEWPPYRKVNP